MEPKLHVNVARANHSTMLASTSESEVVTTVINEISNSQLEDTKSITMETNNPIEKTMEQLNRNKHAIILHFLLINHQTHNIFMETRNIFMESENQNQA